MFTLSLIKLNLFSMAAVRMCFFKIGFLGVSQYSQENTCVGVFFNKVVDLKGCNFKRDPNASVFL